MDELTPIFLMVLGGLSIRYTLIFAGQTWARSYAQTVSFMVLPIITYIITKTISGNIALSLGMIGALSIVRFRHPVKSALELIMYFDLITIGIATSVRTKWAIQLILCTVLILILVKIFQSILKKKNKSFYSLSFNEGADVNSLEIHSTKNLDLVENSNNLKTVLSNPEQNEIIYRLIFENKENLVEFKKKIEKLDEIKKIDVNFI